MGFIRGGLLVIVSVFLFIAFFAGNLLLTISWSLNYENVKVELNEVITTTLQNQVDIDSFVQNDLVDMQNYCLTYSDYPLSFRGNAISIPCSVVSEGQDAIIPFFASEFIGQIYFDEYECGFWDCFSQDDIPFFLVSAKSQAYFYSKFNLVLMSIAVLAILGFLLAEKKSNFFLLTSVLLAISALPFAKFDVFAGLFGDEVQGIISVFFSKAYSVFLASLILGGILLAIGIILKLFKVGFKIQSIFSRGDKVTSEDVKEIVKEEVKATKPFSKKKKSAKRKKKSRKKK